MLSALAAPTCGRIGRQLAPFTREDRDVIRQPHPDLLEVLDPRSTSLLAADLLETIGPTSMLIAESLAAAIHYRSPIFFGDPQNASGAMAQHAETLGVLVTIASPPT